MPVKTVLVAIVVADETHCSSDCDFLSITENPVRVLYEPVYQAKCALFDHSLEWAKRRKYNGYIRCTACLKAEK